MHVINVRNVNHALPAGINYLKQHGIVEGSRNGPVLVAPGPVTTVYERPLERVLFNPLRDANPFLHFFESLWMLAGERHVDYLTNIVPRFQEFSDDGLTLNGAYGHRWRKYFNYDQLGEVVKELRDNPRSRRIVLSMWDGVHDLRNRKSKDVPCNTHCYFNVRDGKLDMTLLNRSNDVVWGAYGANAVHFSYLMEYVATCAELEVGKLYQVSNNYHVYVDRPDVQKLFNADRVEVVDPYANDNAWTFHSLLISTTRRVFERELRMFIDTPEEKYFAEPFFAHTAAPLRDAFDAHKAGNTSLALDLTYGISDDYWRKAAQEWLERRRKAKEAKEQGPCASTPVIGVDANGSEVVG